MIRHLLDRLFCALFGHEFRSLSGHDLTICFRCTAPNPKTTN